MARDRTDTSSISFTALYTGQVWNQHGLSAPGFDTAGGRFYYHAMTPFEYIGGKLVGGNIRTFLLQRHQVIDDRAADAIENRGVTQVLEIACGLSPRGARLADRYPHITYVEADLPDMAARKQALLERQNRLSNRHYVVECNVLARETPDALEKVLAGLDLSQPVLVITEGLVNYFDLDTIAGFWERLALALHAFPRGLYLADNYPLYEDMAFLRTMRVLGGLLGSVSRSQVSFHFQSDDEARTTLTDLGFQRVTVHDPAAFYERLPIPRSRGRSFVRVIEAETEQPGDDN
jgi:O-methyltransferase involved in polyketide biosynthesis